MVGNVKDGTLSECYNETDCLVVARFAVQGAVRSNGLLWPGVGIILKLEQLSKLSTVCIYFGVLTDISGCGVL